MYRRDPNQPKLKTRSVGLQENLFVCTRDRVEDPGRVDPDPTSIKKTGSGSGSQAKPVMDTN